MALYTVHLMGNSNSQQHLASNFRFNLHIYFSTLYKNKYIPGILSSSDKSMISGGDFLCLVFLLAAGVSVFTLALLSVA